MSLQKSASLLSDPITEALEQLNLGSLLASSQIDARVAAAERTKNQALLEPRAPAASAPVPSSGATVSSQAALNSISDLQQVPDVARSSAAAVPSVLNGIFGTPNADDITGTAQADAINGLQGNDTIRGANGNDIIVGNLGDDVISGDHVPSQTTVSNDTIYGGAGNDKLFGRIGQDNILGGTGNDQLFGGSGLDRLIGGSGDDQLFGGIVPGDASFNPNPDGRDLLVGGAGSDFLDGGAGNDYINGSNNDAKGAGELDLLTGGSGRDAFVLGTRAGAYYTQGGASQDFGLILDFEQGDFVWLFGDASEYVLGYDAAENSTALGYLASGSFELVGVFAGVELSDAALTNGTFQYL